MAYKHVIRAKTKNLFNKNNATIINGYIYSGQLIITESPVDRTIVFPCKPNTMYTFSKMYTNRLFMAETSEETPAIGTTCTNPIASLGEPPSQNYCTLTTTATAKNLIITVCALFNTETYTLQEILDSVQIEEGSTPTPYTPYNYLQSNKRMIKVSDVCQLYAKNIWREGNFYGVSIKNNNDGSITLNGTATETFFYTNILDYEIKPNHKYLYFDYYPQTPSWDTYVGGCEGKVNHESAVIFAIYNTNNDGTIDPSSPTLPSNTLLNTFCMCYKGFTFNNITIKPQLFDLTEMFGAGHEPATVAEFRQRFPNEYYPYSPQCWLTSYKSAVVCKTKNLFDVNKITESTNLKNNKDGTITVSVYGVSGGLLKNLCPELKVGDVIKVYFQPLRWTAPKPPLVMVVGDVIFDRNGNSTLTVTEKSLNKPVWFYNNDYDERGLPGTTIIGNILITTNLTITNKNYNVRYTPYQHL